MAGIREVLVLVPVLASLTCSAPSGSEVAPGASLAARHGSPEEPSGTGIAWSPCGGVFECATFEVPLDHREQGGATIAIALARLPARDPARCIGTLFLEPGGPGDSGVDFVMEHGPTLFTDEVRARFDLVGFDPRGQGRSTPLRCVRSLEALAPALHAVAFPRGAAQEAAWIAADRYLDAACHRREPRIAEHMSSANVARDLDLLREAVGDRTLTYVGYSSGTFIGATYANLFPHRVRALVLDGALDPVAWATGAPGEGRRIPATTRIRAADGAQATLEEFFRLCDQGAARCPFAGDGSARFAALVARLAAEPILLPLPDGSFLEVDDTTLVGFTRDQLADSLGGWPVLAEQLAGLEALVLPAAAAPATALAGLALGRGALSGAALRAPGGGVQEAYRNDGLEGRYGALCVDTLNPRSYAAWSRAAEEGGLFGPYWTWFSSRCAEWPFSDEDRYRGPFEAVGAAPALVIGNRFDPATRYQGAAALAATLRGAVLLTVHGWGHSSHGWGPQPRGISRCADELATRYLVDLELPAPGTVCDQDVTPFAGP